MRGATAANIMNGGGNIGFMTHYGGAGFLNSNTNNQQYKRMSNGGMITGG